ncbi:MATE family efflux transporter [Dielma fastidiosa]|uniref:MATE family efflux transporter n=1 Tax=Dielma fastidiosa TaxID=1034346 RepID=UPI003568912D
MRKYFGSRQFNGQLLKLAMPIMIQNVINSSLNFIDNLMVGQLGSAVIGGIAASNRFFAIMNSGTASITGTCGIFISQFYGANNEEKIKESFRIAIWISFLLMIPFLIGAWFFPNLIISFFIDDPQIIDVGVRYMRIMGFSYIPLCYSSAVGSAMRSIGKPKMPMTICGISVTIKLLLNFIFMFGAFGMPGMGVEGAAAATVITRFIEAGLYAAAMKINAFVFATKLREMHQITWPLLKRIVYKAVPFYLNDMLWQASNSVILKCFGTRGELNYSAYAIASTIMDIFHTFDGGIGSAVTVFISQKLGNGDLKHAQKSGYQAKGFSMSAAVILFIMMLCSCTIIPVIYSGSPAEVISVSQKLILLQSAGFLFYELSMMNYYIFKAGGDTRSIVIMDCGLVWIIHVPLLVGVAYYTGLNIYALMGVNIFAEMVKFLVATGLFKQEHWIKNLAKS